MSETKPLKKLVKKTTSKTTTATPNDTESVASTRSVKKPKVTMSTLPQEMQETIQEKIPKIQQLIVRHNLEFDSTQQPEEKSSKHRPAHSKDTEKISDSELEL